MATLHTNHRKAQRSRARKVPALTIEFAGGTTIEQAASDAVALAKTRKRAVAFNFNGIKMVAPPSRKTAANILANSFIRQSEKRAEDWRNSPEGLAYAAERAKELAERQAAVTSAIQALPEVLAIQSLGALIGWLTLFVEDANDTGIDWEAATGIRGEPLEWIVLQLIAAGYRENEYVGTDPELFTRERLGRWIVGQAINCLRLGLPPHPITQKFAKEYFAT